MRNLCRISSNRWNMTINYIDLFAEWINTQHARLNSMSVCDPKAITLLTQRFPHRGFIHLFLHVSDLGIITHHDVIPEIRENPDWPPPNRCFNPKSRPNLDFTPPRFAPPPDLQIVHSTCIVWCRIVLYAIKHDPKSQFPYQNHLWFCDTENCWCVGTSRPQQPTMLVRLRSRCMDRCVILRSGMIYLSYGGLPFSRSENCVAKPRNHATRKRSVYAVYDERHT